MATTMAAQRGTKRFCISEPCGRAFYDLKKEPTDCPYCGEDYVAPEVVPMRSPAEYGKKSYYKTYKHLEAPIAPAAVEAAEPDAEAEEQEPSNQWHQVERVLPGAHHEARERQAQHAHNCRRQTRERQG